MTLKEKRSARSRSRNLHAEIAAQIGARICAGEFPPGSILPNEAQWGRLFKASRTSVREAMKALQAKGLVISKPKIGSRVAPQAQWNLLDRDVFGWHSAAVGRRALLEKTQEFRRHFEPGIAELAARKRKGPQLEALAGALAGMRGAADDAAMIAADLAFHRALLACTNNELLNPFAVLLEQTLGTLFGFTTKANRRGRIAIQLHERIYRAVRDQDARAARKAMQALLADTDAIIGL